MSVLLAYLPEAEDDIAEAFSWYEEQLAGLGLRFTEALQQVLKRIEDNPNLYGVFRRDIRAAPLRRFPYVVYYRSRSSDVLIVAVQRGQRSTRVWRGRI